MEVAASLGFESHGHAYGIGFLQYVVWYGMVWYHTYDVDKKVCFPHVLLFLTKIQPSLR